jgi:hypothetical protein
MRFFAIFNLDWFDLQFSFWINSDMKTSTKIFFLLQTLLNTSEIWKLLNTPLNRKPSSKLPLLLVCFVKDNDVVIEG